jgi:hypothetical protein
MVSSHGTEANPKLCATCHVSRFSGTDQNGVPFTSVGHSFEATPCLSPTTGLPVAGDCAVEQRSFAGCVASGCHSSPQVARAAFVTVRLRMNRLLDELWTDTDGDRALEPTDGGLLPGVYAARGLAELDPSTSTITVAKGAIWNALLAFTDERTVWQGFTVGGKTQAAHKGSGEGVHNPFLLEALLLASIDAVEERYGVRASPSLMRAPQLRQPPRAQ